MNILETINNRFNNGGEDVTEIIKLLQSEGNINNVSVICGETLFVEYYYNDRIDFSTITKPLYTKGLILCAFRFDKNNSVIKTWWMEIPK